MQIVLKEGYIALDKALYFSTKKYLYFLFLYANICYGFLLEAPLLGTSNKYIPTKYAFVKK